MSKREKGQPEDTTGCGGAGSCGSSKEGFKPQGGKENKGGNAPRQDGKNSIGKVEAYEVGGWKMEDSLPGEKHG